jgi:hypothetical protein
MVEVSPKDSDGASTSPLSQVSPLVPNIYVSSADNVIVDDPGKEGKIRNTLSYKGARL